MNDTITQAIVSFFGLLGFGIGNALGLCWALNRMDRNFKRDMEQLRIDHERRMAELNKPYFPQSVYDPPVE